MIQKKVSVQEKEDWSKSHNSVQGFLFVVASRMEWINQKEGQEGRDQYNKCVVTSWSSKSDYQMIQKRKRREERKKRGGTREEEKKKDNKIFWLFGWPGWTLLIGQRLYLCFARFLSLHVSRLPLPPLFFVRFVPDIA